MKIAIFDLDGTLSEGASGALLSAELEKKKIIKPGLIKAKEKVEAEYRSKQIEYNDIYKPFFEAIKNSYAGTDFLEVYKYTKEEYKPINYVYEWVPPLFAELHKRDYLITIVSASLEFYLDILQNDLDFDTFYASQLEVINGKFTGECKLAVTDKTKSLYIKSIKKNNSLIVVGDSQGDVPMLELADKGFYLLHKSGSNIDEKPDLANVEIVTHENVVEKILAVA